MTRDRYVTHYKGSMELDDGRTLTIRFWAKHICSGHPENDCGEPSFEVDGESFSRSELPEEVTAEVIEKLMSHAKRDDDWDSL